MEPKKVVLAIVDISGYTRFIKSHKTSQIHAEEIIFDLLEAVIDRAEYPLSLNKLEGDALFLYAELIAGEETAVACDVVRQVQVFFEAFHTRKDELVAEREDCSCNACQHVWDLRLKAFLHQGEVFFRKIRQFEELAGEDVILIHRLLKNTIPASEYIAATGTFVELTGDYFSDTRSEIRQEYYDDLGMVTMQVFYPSNSHKISKKYRISS
ncbi:MAG: hypothetical protein DPW09_41835 [Anaerolineae bacterium]|nr:hypothetical protein [Anaerolineae bacterium]